MTKVTFYSNSDGLLTGFCCEGHTGYGEEGTDIVCAAVSALVISAVQSIEQLTSDEIELSTEEESATISLRVKETPSHDCHLLLHSLILGLEGIEDQYTEYIDVIVEEV